MTSFKASRTMVSNSYGEPGRSYFDHSPIHYRLEPLSALYLSTFAFTSSTRRLYSA